MKLEDQSAKATELLAHKTVQKVLRPSKREVIVEFTDGTRLFVDTKADELELSIT